jgi:hypothetical protein
MVETEFRKGQVMPPNSYEQSVSAVHDDSQRPMKSDWGGSPKIPTPSPNWCWKRNAAGPLALTVLFVVLSGVEGSPGARSRRRDARDRGRRPWRVAHGWAGGSNTKIGW